MSRLPSDSIPYRQNSTLSFSASWVSASYLGPAQPPAILTNWSSRPPPSYGCRIAVEFRRPFEPSLLRTPLLLSVAVPIACAFVGHVPHVAFVVAVRCWRSLLVAGCPSLLLRLVPFLFLWFLAPVVFFAPWCSRAGRCCLLQFAARLLLRILTFASAGQPRRAATGAACRV